MRTAEELAALLAGEQFQNLDKNRRKIVVEASKSLIFAVALSEAISIYVTKDEFRKIMDYAVTKSVELLTKIFGCTWIDSEFRKINLKQESPSD